METVTKSKHDYGRGNPLDPDRLVNPHKNLVQAD